MSIASKQSFASFIERDNNLFTSPTSSIINIAKEIAYDEIMHEKIYKELLKEYDFYYNSILSRLSEDSKEYMYELEEINEQIRYILIYSAFNRGLSNGCLLYRAFKTKMESA